MALKHREVALMSYRIDANEANNTETLETIDRLLESLRRNIATIESETQE